MAVFDMHTEQERLPLTIPKSDSSGFFIPTLNNTGYMTTRLDPYSQAFVEYAAQTQGSVLEIGAAYGIATLAALSLGAKIYCNDLDSRHLQLVVQQAAEQKLDLSRLITVPGAFPKNIDFPANALDGILMCRVLHFFNGPKIERSIQKAYQWLKEGGKIFIVAETPYLKTISAFIPKYEQNVKKGLKWPGLIRNLHQYFNDTKVPKLINSMDITVMTRVLESTGFVIEKISYLDRQDFPENRRLDGRESIGVVAYKPMISQEDRG